MRAAYFLPAFIALACSDSERRQVERTEFVDTGALCVRSEPDDKVSVRVIVDTCASGCSRISAATCELVVANTELGLHSAIQVEERVGPDVACPSVCVEIQVSCAAMAVSPGEYTIRHGDDVATIRLPAERPLLLGGGSTQAGVQCQ